MKYIFQSTVYMQINKFHPIYNWKILLYNEIHPDNPFPRKKNLFWFQNVCQLKIYILNLNISSTINSIKSIFK